MKKFKRTTNWLLSAQELERLNRSEGRKCYLAGLKGRDWTSDGCLVLECHFHVAHLSDFVFLDSNVGQFCFALDLPNLCNVVVSVAPGVGDLAESAAEELENADEDGAAAGQEHDPNDDCFLVRTLDVASDNVVARFPVALVRFGHHHLPRVDLEVVSQEKSFDQRSEKYLKSGSKNRRHSGRSFKAICLTLASKVTN